jgi:hypothetical protein
MTAVFPAAQACEHRRRTPPAFARAGFVGDQRIGFDRGQQLVGPDQVVYLAAGQEEVDRVAQRIDQSVDLGAQSAARAPGRLVLAVFSWAPALCACVRIEFPVSAERCRANPPSHGASRRSCCAFQRFDEGPTRFTGTDVTALQR